MARFSKHATLVGSTVLTVDLGGWYEEIEVTNRDGAAEVYFTVDGTDPTVAGDSTEVLPAAISGLTVGPVSNDNVTVKLISAGTPKISIAGR